MRSVVGQVSRCLVTLRSSARRGQGSEGEVFDVNDRAVKLYNVPLSESRNEKTRFLIEFARRLPPGIAWPYDIALDAATHEAVGEFQPFVRGRSLRVLLDEKSEGQPLFPVELKLWYARQLAAAVANVHAIRRPTILLGDVITASNVIIDGTSATFVDANSTSVLGFRSMGGELIECIEDARTPGYVPPEVLESPALKPSIAQDEFALAKLLFELFYGRSATDCPAAVGLDPDDAVRWGIYPAFISNASFPPPTYDAVLIAPESEKLFRAAFFSIADRPSALMWVDSIDGWLAKLSPLKARRMFRWALRQATRTPGLAVTLSIAVALIAEAVRPTPVRPRPTPALTPVHIAPPTKCDSPPPEATVQMPVGPPVGPQFFTEFFE